MKRSIRINLLAAVLVATSPISAFGTSSEQSDPRAEAIAKLEGRAGQVDAKLARIGPQQRADVPRNVHRKQLRDQRRQLRGLIEKLEAGQQVDPAEIDRVLRAD